MNVTYNGNSHSIESPCTLEQFLETVGKVSQPMMVKLNSTLIPGKDINTVQLKDGDVLSVIIFMGGG